MNEMHLELNLQAFSTLQTARHVCGYSSSSITAALLASCNGVVAEGVLLAGGARIVRGSGDVRRADAVAGGLVAPGRGRTAALLAIWEAEEVRRAPRALPTDDVGLTLALAADGRALVEGGGALAIAVAVQSAAVEVGGQGHYGVAAEGALRQVSLGGQVEVVLAATQGELGRPIQSLRQEEGRGVALGGDGHHALQPGRPTSL